MDTRELLFELHDDGIGRVVFNRPQARNALTFEMYDRLVDLCELANVDPRIRVLLLSGAGGQAFAAGTDVEPLKSLTTAERVAAYEARVERTLRALETCRVPTVAAIAGACTGGGLIIAAACDLRIGAADARLGMPIARTLGNCLSAKNAARIVALTGIARFRAMVFSARLFTGEEAFGVGLLSEVADSVGSLHERADVLARTVAGHSPLTLQSTRELLRRMQAAVENVEDMDLLTRCYTSNDFQEGIAAFLGKRAPHWRGD